MSRLIKIFTVCLVNFFYSNDQNIKQTRSLSEFSCTSEFTRLYHNIARVQLGHIYRVNAVFARHRNFGGKKLVILASDV